MFYNSLRIDTNYLIIIGLYVMGLIIVVLSPHVLPERYYFDNYTLISLIQDAANSALPKSFVNTAILYKLMSFGTIIPVSVGRYIIYTLSFIFVLLPNKNFVKTVRFFSVEHVLIVLWLIILSVYLGQYSKELFSLFLIFILFKSVNNKYSFMLSILLIILYASYVRIYWFIVLFFFLIIYYLSFKKLDKYLKITIFILVVLVFYYMVHIVTGRFITDARYNINIARIGSGNAHTMIHNLFINTSILTDIGNTLYGWLLLLIPINMIYGGVFQSLFALIQIITFCFIIYKIIKNLRLFQSGYKVFLDDNYKRKLYAAIAWTISFSFVEAMFEPDYGTFSRHELAILPMIVFIMFYLSKPGMVKIKTINNENI